MNRRSFVALLPATGWSLMHPRMLHAAEAEVAAMDDDLTFDLHDIPFSAAGSFLVFNLADETPKPRVRIATVRKGAVTYRYQTGSWSHDLFDVDLLKNGAALDYEIHATPEQLTLRAGDAHAVVRFATPETLHFELHGAELRLRAPRNFAWRVVEQGRQVRAFDFASGYDTEARAGSGTELRYERASTREREEERLTLRAASGHGEGDLRFEVQREQVPNAPPTRPNPSFADWMRLCPPDADPATAHATRIAWFLFWNLRVDPLGGYTRSTVLSSKRTLSQIWSWDNLFNALAIAKADNSLAWDQLGVVLDHQLPSGMLPDTVGDAGQLYGFNKPPVWGWALGKLLPLTPEWDRVARLREVYPKVSRFHRWWFLERDLRGDGVPAYVSGNDSGWDNATVFTDGWPVQSPDLLAWLTLDAERLAECAHLLSLESEAAAWRQESERLLQLFHLSFVRGDRLVYHVLDPAGVRTAESTTLLTRLPLLLGARLDPAVAKRIVAELKDEQLFRAPSGPSTEMLHAPLYDPNGYWRGPVWGPSTLLICDALRGVGEHELAAEYARKYRRTCARRADFRENYDAITGEGRYDTGMTWSAADYLLLRHFV